MSDKYDRETRKIIHEMQAKHNREMDNMKQEMEQVNMEVKESKHKVKVFVRWVGTGLILASFIFILGDNILAVLSGTRLLSTSYNPTFGLWQGTMAGVAGVVGIFLSVVGWKK